VPSGFVSGLRFGLASSSCIALGVAGGSANPVAALGLSGHPPRLEEARQCEAGESPLHLPGLRVDTPPVEELEHPGAPNVSMGVRPRRL